MQLNDWTLFKNVKEIDVQNGIRVTSSAKIFLTPTIINKTALIYNRKPLLKMSEVFINF